VGGEIRSEEREARPPPCSRKHRLSRGPHGEAPAVRQRGAVQTTARPSGRAVSCLLGHLAAGPQALPQIKGDCRTRR
jgi:hypothetical protein